ncbi:superoxide dismutase [Candidatus Similichlamydia laticola]|uniref:Superoxide dismutase n=1 Tax=Candidatus Similichlamydia laticola TaxID=2170265 RepID=A0A369KD16_9BACT|nr:superoxide dismutase [Candidatus Similichlamydia laticola]RDB31350.1 Manganese superoxide dismutase [Candidatus Similichlamydia laticola]
MKLPFALPKLEYDYNELEPWISEEIMELHHKKHHTTYLDNLLREVKKLKESPENLIEWVHSSPALAFNGGGHLNHTLFWASLLPSHRGGGLLRRGPLQEAIFDTFGSLEQLIDKMKVQAANLQGSGWCWLGQNENGFFITTTPNQTALSLHQGIPLLGIDLWEHAYYLQYKNMKMKYFEAIWNVINWEEIEKRFLTQKGVS